MPDEPTIPAAPAIPAAAVPATPTPVVDPKVADPKAAGPTDPAAAKPDAKPAEKKTLEQKLADKKAAEGKPDDKKPDVKDGGKKPDEKAGDIEITLPKDAKVDTKVLTEFKVLAKDAGLKSDGAQKLYDFYTKAEAAKAAQVQAADDKQQDEWEAEILKWPDAEEQLGLAKKAILGLADENAQAFLQVPFIGSNPSMVKFLAKVGKMMSEAPLHEGSGTPARAWTLDDVFPTMAKKK